MLGTTVLQQRHVPPRPSRFDGLIRILDLPPKLRTEAALRRTLSSFGDVLRCEMELHAQASRSRFHATAAFANHVDAEAAVFSLKARDAMERTGVPLPAQPFAPASPAVCPICSVAPSPHPAAPCEKALAETS